MSIKLREQLMVDLYTNEPLRCQRVNYLTPRDPKDDMK